MPHEPDFRHLPLPMVLKGKPKLHGGGPKPPGRTTANRANRHEHGAYIKNRTAELSRFWRERRDERTQERLPAIEKGIPILVEVDPTTDIDFLRGLGFEIVCEIEEGFIIVATDDVDLQRLNQKVDEFIANIKRNCNSPAKVYALCEDDDRLKKVLSPDLYSKWPTIEDGRIYSIDIGVSCSGHTELPSRPTPKENETEQHFAAREARWQGRYYEAYMVWDELKIKREMVIESFVQEYGGEILQFVDGSPSIAPLPDSFSARLQINGRCLRDLVLNASFIFEVSESEIIDMGAREVRTQPTQDDVNIIPPDDDDPIVCVIDSGIQEAHRYIAPAIRSHESKCLLPSTTSVNDEVGYGGHGTRVAGAVLYPKTIPVQGEYKLPCWIRNVRVLGADNCMPIDLFPPKVISTVVQEFTVGVNKQTKILNHSIGASRACELKHMSSWAAEIDLQSYENDVLFVQAAGNIPSQVICAYIRAKQPYPNYLDRELSRVCDPAQSLQALTVGSVSACDYETDDSIVLGSTDEAASFSRSGPGIWDVVKPEVVEYGGTFVKNKRGAYPVLTTPEEVCPELIRKSPEGPAFSRDEVGTSFAAPKVAHIAAEIEKILPDAPALLYRALIAQSARWPDYSRGLDKTRCLALLRRIGYGIPNLARATHNDDYRVTLVTPTLMEIGEGEAHVFKVPIPEQLSSVGEDFDVLIEVTLSYAARPRRTRRYIKGYLSSWVDWCCSRIGESYSTFAQRVFRTGSVIDDDGDFDWMLGDAVNRGTVEGFSRKRGTLQKDWCIIKSNQLSDAFCIAVRGHAGWGSLFKAKYALTISFEAIDQDITIYERIQPLVGVEVEAPEIEVEVSRPVEPDHMD